MSEGERPGRPEGGARTLPLHEQPDRARSFGEDAERYERVRPTYPPAVAEDLGARPGRRVLDVGCGTGKAGRLFSSFGCEVLGVEVDARMAAVARRSGLEVEVGTFEDWDDFGRRFDLVVSGQAWHWVSPEIGARKAARVLVAGGRLAPFWNYRRPAPEEVRDAFDGCYERFAPELRDRSLTLGITSAADHTANVQLNQLRSSGCFEEPEIRRYRWGTTYSASEWRELISTHSDHRLLGPERLVPLLDAIEVLIEDDFAGTLPVEYETIVVDAARRAVLPEH